MNTIKWHLFGNAIIALSLFLTVSAYSQTLSKSRELVTVNGNQKWSHFLVSSTDTLSGVTRSTNPIFRSVILKRYNNEDYAICLLDIDDGELYYHPTDSSAFWIFLGHNLEMRHIFPQACTMPADFHDGFQSIILQVGMGPLILMEMIYLREDLSTQSVVLIRDITDMNYWEMRTLGENFYVSILLKKEGALNMMQNRSFIIRRI